MARPIKVSVDAICQYYHGYLNSGVQFPVSATAKALGISKLTVNRGLSKAIEEGLMRPTQVHSKPLHLKKAEPKQELVVLITGLPYGTWT